LRLKSVLLRRGVFTLVNALAELMTPKQSQKDQSNDESVAQLVRCG
jgi:hypothetical protein